MNALVVEFEGRRYYHETQQDIASLPSVLLPVRQESGGMMVVAVNSGELTRAGLPIFRPVPADTPVRDRTDRELAYSLDVVASAMLHEEQPSEWQSYLPVLREAMRRLRE